MAPTEGSVRVFGEPAGQDQAALARVAFMPQDKPLSSPSCARFGVASEVGA